MSKPSASRHSNGPLGRGGARNQLGDGGSGQQSQEPDCDKLQRSKQPFRLKQQAEHDQAEPEIVGFGQRVQPAERVRKPQQPDRPCQEEESAGTDRQIVSPSRARLISAAPDRQIAGRFDKGDRDKGREQCQYQRDIDGARHTHRLRQQQQRCNPAGAEQLRRHDAVGSAWPAQDAERARAPPSPARNPRRPRRSQPSPGLLSMTAQIALPPRRAALLPAGRHRDNEDQSHPFVSDAGRHGTRQQAHQCGEHISRRPGRKPNG